ncbi:tetratricopeptide repeat protein [Sphingomonas sinipercae]|uniref:Tetratricopeptide repeat protein n=1 Tax=Sphingomonas sinipercae TaxID=2714944 RepID=A0A6G7ZQ97_9SPHN|nr:tetratricopeptide repeat protein [Sphingomonas sinipercae]QIL03092.1 tetratricopeptide repeat protein [Sphingomonas sinipercae]
MVQTPDAPNEAFLREVDENLRRDQARDFAQRYGKWLIAAAVLLLAVTGGYLYWQEHKQKQTEAQSEELAAIYTDIGAGKAVPAKARLQALEDSHSDVIRALTLLTEAAIALEGNDRATALAKYRAVTDADVPQPYRDLALVRATAIEFDTIKPEEVVARLEPLSKPGEPWFASAGEMTALAYLKQGRKAQAGKLFAAIVGDSQAPASARSRASQIAGTLGVDASAALAAAN